MPPLGPIVDLRDDPRLDMQIMAGAGQAIGNVVAARRIKQEEQYNQLLQQQLVGMISRASVENWDGGRLLDEMAKLPEMTRTEYGRQLQMQLAMDQYQRMMAAQTPKGLPYGVPPEQFAKANRAEMERKIAGDQEANILHGPGGMKYTYDPATKTATPIQGIQPSGSRETEEMKVIQAMSETEKQIDLLKRAIEEGFDQDGNPADAGLLRSEIARLEGLNANRRKRLSGSEALADYDRVKGTVERDLNRGDEVKRIGESMPLSGYLEGIEQTRKAGVFDKVKDPAAIRAAMGRHVQDLVAQGLTLPEARAETERQFRLLQTADTGWFKTLPSEPMWAPLGAEYEGDEQFLADYKAWAKLNGLNENPDDPGHKYDYRAYYKKYGKFPTKKGEHLPAEFKTEGHPTRLVNGLDTTKEHSDEEILAAYNGDRAAAEQDGWQFSDKNQEPPVPELAPFWKGMSEEERATAVEYLRQGGDVKRIIGMLK